MLDIFKNFIRYLLTRIRIYRKKLKRPNKYTPKKLHLGCGNISIKEYCNIDIIPLATVDIVDDIKRLKKFPNNFAEQIYACHVLEHLSQTEVIETLNRWFNVLKSGGELRISVPDIDKIVKVYYNNWQHFQTKGNTPWIGLIYGGQTNRYDFHKTGFNFNWMSYLLKQVGFISIEQYPHTPHFIPDLIDASLANQPFGEYISLNVKAKKP